MLQYCSLFLCAIRACICSRIAVVCFKLSYRQRHASSCGDFVDVTGMGAWSLSNIVSSTWFILVLELHIMRSFFHAPSWCYEQVLLHAHKPTLTNKMKSSHSMLKDPTAKGLNSCACHMCRITLLLKWKLTNPQLITNKDRTTMLEIRDKLHRQLIKCTVNISRLEDYWFSSFMFFSPCLFGQFCNFLSWFMLASYFFTM